MTELLLALGYSGSLWNFLLKKKTHRSSFKKRQVKENSKIDPKCLLK